MRKIPFLIIVLSIFLFSCKKQENNQNKYVNKNLVTNPYEWVGYHHNQGLDSVAYSENFPNLSEEEALQMLNDYSIIHFGDYDYLSPQEQMKNFIDNPWPISESVKIFYTAGLMTEIQYEYVLELESVLLVDSMAIDYTLDNIYKIEQKLSSDKNISDDDKIYVWCMLAISKYSYKYWYYGFLDKDNPWYPVLNGSKMPFGRWLVVHAADFYGFNHGFFIDGVGRDYDARVTIGHNAAMAASYNAGYNWDLNH